MEDATTKSYSRSIIDASSKRAAKHAITHDYRVDGSKKRRKTLLIRFGSKYHEIAHDEIAYIYRSETINVIVMRNENRIPVDRSLNELLMEFDSRQFTRLSQVLIAHIGSIKGLVQRDGVSLSIDLDPDLGLHFTYDSRFSSEQSDYRSLLKNIRKESKK